MKYAVETKPSRYHAEPAFPFPDVELIESDGVPLESFWHYANIALLVDSLSVQYAGRDDYFCGGNMFLYYSVEQARNGEYRGPDFFFVNNVPKRKKRRWWAVWEEDGRFPNVIVELSSPSTVHIDHVTKKELYEQTFHTEEYFCYDFDTRKVEGWRLDEHQKYQPIEPNENGWLWSEELGLWLGVWQGEYLDCDAPYLRFYTPDGKLVPCANEAAQTQADAATAQAEEQRRRAEDAEAEVKRLKAQLAKSKKKKK